MRILSFNILAPHLFIHFWRSYAGDNSPPAIIDLASLINDKGLAISAALDIILEEYEPDIILLQETTDLSRIGLPHNRYSGLIKAINNHEQLIRTSLHSFDLVAESYKSVPMRWQFPSETDLGSKNPYSCSSGVSTYVRKGINSKTLVSDNKSKTPITVVEIINPKTMLPLTIVNVHVAMNYPHINLALDDIWTIVTEATKGNRCLKPSIQKTEMGTYGKQVHPRFTQQTEFDTSLRSCLNLAKPDQIECLKKSYVTAEQYETENYFNGDVIIAGDFNANTPEAKEDYYEWRNAHGIRSVILPKIDDMGTDRTTVIGEQHRINAYIISDYDDILIFHHADETVAMENVAKMGKLETFTAMQKTLSSRIIAKKELPMYFTDKSFEPMIVTDHKPMIIDVEL